MSHSKRNTSRPVFTAHERALAKAAWSSSSARLSRESFLPFASCSLCLEDAVDPVACARGDIFCRECALSNILAQKKEIKRLEKARELEEREALEERARQEAEAQERAIREFELTQAGLDPKGGRRPSATAASGVDDRREERSAQEVPEQKRGEKRKFSLDPDELERIAADERAKARKAIEEEKAMKPTLPSFWTPSITPTSNKNNILHEVKKKTKTRPVCPASAEDSPHYYSLHELITVRFTEDGHTGGGDNARPQRVCPACKKALSNASKAMLAKPCGHVVCRGCVFKFMQPSGRRDPHAPEADPEGVRCYVCDANLSDSASSPEEKKGKGSKDKIRPGLVEIHSDGTGFSAGGANQVKRNGVAFQC